MGEETTEHFHRINKKVLFAFLFMKAAKKKEPLIRKKVISFFYSTNLLYEFIGLFRSSQSIKLFKSKFVDEEKKKKKSYSWKCVVHTKLKETTSLTPTSTPTENFTTQ